MEFGGNTRELSLFGEETDKTTTLHQELYSEPRDGVPTIKRWRHDIHRDGTNQNNLESDDESVDTPLVSPFPHSDNDSDDGEVLNELIEYKIVGILRQEKAISSFDGKDLAFQCIIGFRKFVTDFDPFLPINIITCKAYNTIMVEGLKSTGKNLVAIDRDVYVFVSSFTYITDFVVIFDKKKLGSS
ncbi:hypothetical protein Tco_0585663 [Tanacetum coccineum]